MKDISSHDLAIVLATLTGAKNIIDKVMRGQYGENGLYKTDKVTDWYFEINKMCCDIYKEMERREEESNND